MKKYTIHFNYYATKDVDVVADSDEQAMKLATDKVELLQSNFDMCLNEKTIIEKEDVDIEEMHEQALYILKNNDELNIESYPVIHIHTISPIGTIVKECYVNDIYAFDEAEGGIGVEYTDNLNYEDLDCTSIDYLSEEDQVKVYECVIRSNEK